jgi:glycosyltransferase involved in cell wall biosynthesis
MDMSPDVYRPSKISVLVATYNRADYLRLCLACLCRQNYAGPWEIVVADDGSTDHTARVMADAGAFQPPCKILHCRHEHDLFRKAVILNKASRLATGDLLAFVDSDCLAAPSLLSTFAAHGKRDSFYLGGVIKLNELFTRQVLDHGESIDPVELLSRASQTGSHAPKQKRRVWLRYLKSRFYSATKYRRPKIWGANFAVNRNVFEHLNGFDENYVGWGQEDSDLRDRLVKAGCRGISLHTKAIVYHLWHTTDMEARWRPSGALNNRAYYKRPDLEAVCRNGLRKR